MKRWETGIYIITNIINNKIYIGSSSYCISNRITVHKRFLKQNNHDNSYLQASYNKYGLENFKFEILEVCDKINCIEREQYWMDLYKSYNRNIGFNINEIANSRLNSKMSEDSKLKMSMAKIGKKLSPEHILKSKLSRTGQKRPQKTIELQNIKKYKKLLQYTIDEVLIKEWSSLQEAEIFFNVKGAIGNCVRRGFGYTSCGFRWRYKVE